MKRISYSLALALSLGAVPIAAQQEDEEESGGMLVDFLQNTLSGDGRTIRVRGLEGALSSKATIEQITVSDDDGVWLTVNNAALDWNRLALIRGRFSVNALTAEEILVDRTPAPSTAAEPLPSPEAQPFQVPELPVAIEVGEIRIDKLGLGEPLIGLAADLEVKGKLTLADGALDSDLGIKRLDRPGDSISLTAQFQNETNQIGIDLQVVEDQGGLISTVLQMPGQPALLLTAKGAGPVTDFTADIGLSSEDTQRVSGQVRLREVPAPDEDTQSSIAFTADLGGDVTPFLEEDFDAFFGTDTQLFLDGQSDPDGAVTISDLSITSDALRLEGEMALAADGKLDKVALQGRITPPHGDRVVLPVANPRTTLEAAQISALLDRANGDHWNLSVTADDLETPDMTLTQARLSADGTLKQGETIALQGDLQADLAGLSFADAALNQAVGSEISLDGLFDFAGDGVLKLSQFNLNGSEYDAQADATIDGLDSGFEVDGKVRVSATDLSRFSGLAGQDLGGAVVADLKGKGAPLSGSFDFTLDVEGQNLRSGMDEIDPLLAGNIDLALDAVRGMDGMTVRRFTLESEALTAEAAAKVTGLGGNLSLDGNAKVDARDLSLFSALAGQDLAGSIRADIEGQGALQSQTFDVRLNLDGEGLQSGFPEVDELIAGQTTLRLDAAKTGDDIDLRNLDLQNPALRAEAVATITGLSDEIAIDGKAKLDVASLSILSPFVGQDLGGKVTASFDGKGALRDQSFDARLDLDATDLRSGFADMDRLIAGRTMLRLDAELGLDDADIRELKLTNPALSADAVAKINGLRDDIAVDGNAKISIADLSLFSPSPGASWAAA